MTIIQYSFNRNNDSSQEKTLAFTNINNKYVNKKIYLDEEKFKTIVFSSLITIPRSFFRLGYFILYLKFFWSPHHSTSMQTCIFLREPLVTVRDNRDEDNGDRGDKT